MKFSLYAKTELIHLDFKNNTESIHYWAAKEGIMDTGMSKKLPKRHQPHSAIPAGDVAYHNAGHLAVLTLSSHPERGSTNAASQRMVQ